MDRDSTEATTFLAYAGSVHGEIIGAARGVLDGTLGLVEAARILAAVSFALGVENDEPFVSFRGIDSETDHYPLGEVRALWNHAALAREDKDRERYETSIREQVEADCRILIAKYQHLAPEVSADKVP